MSNTQGVYLGVHGGVQFKRANPALVLKSTLKSNDVNLNQRRFSFFGSESILTGDKIKITWVSGGPPNGNRLILVANNAAPSIERFAYKDMLGGILLYDTYAEAIEGDPQSALRLQNGVSDQEIRVQIDEDSTWNNFAKITEWSFTTNRETIDITELGDIFRRNYEAGLIQGQGTLTALWDDIQQFCDDDTGSPLDNNGAGHPSDGKPRMPVTEDDELANYFVQLVSRVVLGAKFIGRFYIKYGGDRAVRNRHELAVFWEADCIVTNVSMAFQPDQIVVARIQFVTESKFRLRMMDSDALNTLATNALDTLLTEDGTQLVGRD